MNCSYEYVETHLQKMAAKSQIEISTYYMIGDNPKSDIEGAKRRSLWYQQ